jgi:hypothetical protein
MFAMVAWYVMAVTARIVARSALTFDAWMVACGIFVVVAWMAAEGVLTARWRNHALKISVFDFVW